MIIFFQRYILSGHIILQTDSPNGQLRVTLYQQPRFAMIFPGQGSDGPGVLVLTGIKESKKIFSTKIDICNTIDTIYWKPEEVIAGKMLTIPIPESYYDSIFYKSYYDQKKILVAADQSDTLVINALLKDGTTLNEKVFPHESPVLKAAINEDTFMISWLLKQDKYLQRLNNTKNGLLADQSIINNSKMLAYLLKSGLNPNTPDYYGYTPVYKAIQFENIEALKILFEHGARIDTANTQIQFVLRKARKSFADQFGELLNGKVN